MEDGKTDLCYIYSKGTRFEKIDNQQQPLRRSSKQKTKQRNFKL
ncbi:hypothetical protein COLO4_24754 [Corchorus olitorius]|uniref:Uncharacterized protein n=1 Tax=Corchorus olitorius TaxID=93759 RepID=A0A1R3I7A7_9ROSI|nr:hypothetical protein COLO4_24754 [Corchorus olitorius]